MRAAIPIRWPAWLFLVLVALSLAPLWSVAHLPTADGPSHLYNAWVIAHLGDRAGHPLYGATFELNPRPVPNWLSSALLLVLLRALAPPTAEKALASSYLVLFCASLWFFAGVACRERRWLAFLGFPFSYALVFELGFYNFCFSLAFYMLAVGLWWRRRATPDLLTALALNVVLLLCYLSHVVSLVLALLSIAVLWLSTWRRDDWRRHRLHLAILAPQLALPLWFLLRGGARVQPAPGGFRGRLATLVRLDAVSAFAPTRAWLGIAVSAAFALLVVRSLAARLQDCRPRLGDAEPAARPVRWRDEDGFFILALLLAAIYFLAPEGLAGGSNLGPRLALYPFLALLPWLAPRLGAGLRAATIGLLFMLALADLGVAWTCYGTLDRQIAVYLRALDPVARNSHVLPLTWNHHGGCARAHVFAHLLDYAAIEKGLVDWNDYQAMTDYFPVRFKSGLPVPENLLLEWEPERFPIEEYTRSSEYVLTWAMPEGSALRRRILLFYEEIQRSGPLRLFSRRAVAPRRG